MRIYIYDVPNDLILKYCRIASAMESGYTDALESARSAAHDAIFKSVGIHRACVTRDERAFFKALNETLVDMLYTE